MSKGDNLQMVSNLTSHGVKKKNILEKVVGESSPENNNGVVFTMKKKTRAVV